MGPFIAVYGIVMFVGAIAAATIAAVKNRDVSAWAAWGFLLPPTVLILALMPIHKGRRQRRLSLDEEDSMY